MKIVALLTTEIASGGGFNQSLNAIRQMRRICEGKYEFAVITSVASNVDHLRTLGIDSTYANITLLDRLLVMLQSSEAWQMLQSALRLIGPLERKLKRMNCDLAYFTAPSSLPSALSTLNFVTTLWDVCHLDHPEFPEVRNFHTHARRERNYRASVRTSVLTIVDSERLATLAAHQYQVDPQRILSIPFGPSPFLGLDRDTATWGDEDPVDHDDGYFFYPANLWSHKNHVRILQALVLLKSTGWEPKVVFSGRDEGSRVHLEDFVADHGLRNQVEFAGFVSPTDVEKLYRNALAVVMPTYFGPTNLPPLEAWSLGIPLIYSNSCAEQAGDAALLVDPDSAGELADAMRSCRSAEVRERLKEAGRRRLQAIDAQRVRAEARLGVCLNQFAARRACWR